MKTLLAVVFTSLSVITGAQAATVGFSPFSTSVSVGQNFSLDIVGNFPGSEAIDGGGLNLSFVPSIVNVTGVTINTALFEFVVDSSTINNTVGTVSDIIFNSFANTPTGSFLIATVNFTATGAGNSALTLAESTLNPFALSGMPVPVTLTAGTNVTVASVPVPAALWLLLSSAGLLGWTFSGKRRWV